jgi:hypothetical protein
LQLVIFQANYVAGYFGQLFPTVLVLFIVPPGVRPLSEVKLIYIQVDGLDLCTFYRGHHIVRLFYKKSARKVTLGDEIFDLEADSVLD